MAESDAEQVRPDSQATGVGTGGTSVAATLPTPAQRLVHVRAVQTAGDANRTTVKVYERDPSDSGTTDADVVAEYTGLRSSDRIDDDNIDVPITAPSNNLWFEFIPDAGSNNDYEARAQVTPA